MKRCAEWRTESYDNGVKIVASYLLTPVIVTQENAAESYADDATLFPLILSTTSDSGDG